MKFNFEVLPFSRQIEFPYLRSGYVLNNEKDGNLIPIPLPVIRKKIYAPNRYVRGLLTYRRWNCRRVSSDFGKQDWIYVPPLNMTLAFHFFDVVAAEWRTWKKFYAPPKRVDTILDAGAGCGETAWIFFNWFGAKKVVAIEPDDERYELIQRNAKANGWNIEIHHDYFSPDYLKGVGFAKIDIESAELQFKDAEYPPTVMETHNDQIRSAFVQRSYHDPPFHVVWDNHRGCSLIRNF